MPVNQSRPASAPHPDQNRLFLRDEQLDQAVDLVFAAARTFWRAAAPALEAQGLGPAHYRALAAIRAAGDPPNVSELLEALGVQKQSLAKTLAELEERRLIARDRDGKDQRMRRLRLTPEGAAAETGATRALRERLRTVFRGAGAEAVAGAKAVLAALAQDDDTNTDGL